MEASETVDFQVFFQVFKTIRIAYNGSGDGFTLRARQIFLMENVYIQGIDIALGQMVLRDVQSLRDHLNQIFTGSKQSLIENLIQETEFLLDQTTDGSKTYQEKHDIFNQITNSWLDVWSHYSNLPEAIDLGNLINHLSNYSIAYSSLCLGLALINEGRTGEYKTDLERIVSGFLLLAQTVDVFTDFFSKSELEQIYKGAKNALLISARTPVEYFEMETELSKLVTQLRAYSGLILSRIQTEVEPTLESQLGDENSTQVNPSSRAWWEKITGTFADCSAYDEAMQLGHEYRNSSSSNTAELCDL